MRRVGRPSISVTARQGDAGRPSAFHWKSTTGQAADFSNQ
jgi:hypothetical protein